MVEVNDVSIADLDHRRSLDPIGGERLESCIERALGISSNSIAKILLQGFLALVFEEKNEPIVGLQERGVDSIETRVVQQLRFGERLEVRRSAVIEAVIVFVVTS